MIISGCCKISLGSHIDVIKNSLKSCECYNPILPDIGRETDLIFHIMFSFDGVEVLNVPVKCEQKNHIHKYFNDSQLELTKYNEFPLVLSTLACLIGIASQISIAQEFYQKEKNDSSLPNNSSPRKKRLKKLSPIFLERFIVDS